MKVNRFALLLLAFVLMTSFSLFRKRIRYQGRTYKEGQTIQVYGGIILVGAEPFTRYVIVDDDGERFYLDFSDWDGGEIPQNPASIFLVTGELQIRELKMADGSKSFTERAIVVEELIIPAVESE